MYAIFETDLRHEIRPRDLQTGQLEIDNVLMRKGAFQHAFIVRILSIYLPIDTIVSPLPIMCSVRAGDSSLPGGKNVPASSCMALLMMLESVMRYGPPRRSG
jgi:hypothetical protein